MKKLGLAFLYYQVKEDFEIIKIISIHPKLDLNHEIINELKNKIKDFSDIESFMVMLSDEMKIQENLGWFKQTGDLIGFVDLGDVNLNYATLQEISAIASQVLVFLLRSLVNPFKFSLANFATKCNSQSNIPIVLEDFCNL